MSARERRTRMAVLELSGVEVRDGLHASRYVYWPLTGLRTLIVTDFEHERSPDEIRAITYLLRRGWRLCSWSEMFLCRAEDYVA